MPLIEERNPIYKESLTPSIGLGDMLNKQLIGIDIIVAGERIPIKIKQKYIVKHLHDCWWLEEEYEPYSSPPFVNLYSVRDITIQENTLYITFAYHNQSVFTVTEEEIVALIRVGKKAKRDDSMIQNIMTEIKLTYQ